VRGSTFYTYNSVFYTRSYYGGEVAYVVVSDPG